jgi:cobalamin biosynthesis Mg chelatase CobN
MCSRRLLGGALVASAAALTLFSAPAPLGAASLDDCAQRVIRDWYSGGRVDNVYPLACYRAAIRALPNDVLAYSNADQDIRRALAFARRGRADPGNGPEAAKAAPTRTAAPTTKAAASTSEADTARSAERSSPTPKERRVAAPPTAASEGTTTARAAVPYPIIALAGLSALLLATGAIGWLANRRDRPGNVPDR